MPDGGVLICCDLDHSTSSEPSKGSIEARSTRYTSPSMWSSDRAQQRVFNVAIPVAGSQGTRAQEIIESELTVKLA